MATIYRKTAKGHTEIETRALRLSPRLRSALILVDGRRTDAELQRMILQQPDETLRGLVEQWWSVEHGDQRDATPHLERDTRSRSCCV